MAVVYGNLELPSKIKVAELGKNFARFVAEAFEKGGGHTLGNVLRRFMLMFLEAPAIVSIRMEGVPNEYMAMEGVIEDMTHIILNVKSVLLRKLPSYDEYGSREIKVVSKVLDITQEMIDQGKGQYIVTLRDCMGHSAFELVNPELKLFTVTKPMTRRIEFKVAMGKGYVPSERHQMPEKLADEILVDAIFAPVRLVNYYVENTRVGQDTDFDRLILEVTTDGRISPEEALTFATQIAVIHLQIFDQMHTHTLTFDTGELESSTDKDVLMAKLILKINEIELSVRSTNCLSGANIETIAELVVMPESDMLKFRNFGKKSLNEIKAKLEEMHLGLGMDLSKFGITRDNVKQVIQEYLASREEMEIV